MGLWPVLKAANVIEAGGVIAYPTETIWGFGCDPWNQEAVLHLLAVKQRPIDKGLILLISDWQQAGSLITPLSSELQQRLKMETAKPITWVLPVSEHVPNWLTGGRDTIAIRRTTHPFCIELCHRIGPIVSTSANHSQGLAARSRWQCIRQFRQQLDWIAPGESLGQASSSIRDAISGQWYRH